MAVTSIWRVKGWLGKVVVYVENPDKTTNPAYYEKEDMSEKECQGLACIQEYEDQQLSKFKSEFEHLCSCISGLNSWNYSIIAHRWMDTSDKWRNKQFDGYTATLQVDFSDADGNLIELDEYVGSFFENITFISFDPFRHTYRVFQNEKLENIRAEIIRFIRNYGRIH